MDKTEVTKVSPELERAAAQRARDRANAARWDLNAATPFPLARGRGKR
ncbi:unnamed protein product, partial [marine sediment metagenome]